MKAKFRFFLFVFAPLISVCSCALAVWADNWPQFRGGAGNGISSERNLPVKWSATENLKWKTKLPGPGHSSPIVSAR